MSKIAAVCITDTHLKESNIDINKAIFEQAMQFCLNNNIKTLYHKGDIFQSRKAQTLLVLNAFLEILDKLHTNNIKLIAIPGNHDKTDYNSYDSFLDPFETHPALQLIRRAGWIVENKDYAIAMVPFFSDERYVQEITSLKKTNSKKRFCLTHIGVNEAVMNNGIVVQSNVKTELFKDFNTVLIGHYHDQQELDKNIFYSGSSIQHNFGEMDDKGLTVLYDDGEFEKVALEYPRYIKREYFIKNLIPKDIQQLQKQYPNDFIKIVLKGVEKDIKTYNIQQLIDLGVTVVLDQIPIEKDVIENRIEPFGQRALYDSFQSFCKEKKLSHKDGLNYFNQIDFNLK